MEPARVLVVVDSLLVGGAERCAVDMAAALDRDRFAPRLLVTRGGGPLATVLDAAGVPYEVLGRTRRIDVRAAARLRRAIAASDLVHAHKFSSGALAALVGPRHVPMLVHEHNWSGAPGRVHALLNRQLIAKRASRILCVSESVRDDLRSQGVPSQRMTTLPNAVALDAAVDRVAARRRLGLDPDAWIVGMVAGLRPEKAHEVALAALADERVARDGMRLCVVGSGPREQELRRVAREFGVSDRVDWVGAVDDLAVGGRPPASAGAAYASAFDASLVCSDWEGLPLFALESMAAGTPVVATAVGELPSLLRDGAGQVVPTRDPAAIATACASLRSDTAAARSMSTRARDRIAAEHSMSRLVDQLQGLYDEALRPRRSDSGARVRGRAA